MNEPSRRSRSGRSIREAVAVFHDAPSLEAAVDDLLSSGFDRLEISLLASERAVEQKLGHRYRKVAELEDDPRAPRHAYVSQESIGDAEGGLIGGLMYLGAVAAGGAVVASGGTLAGAFLAAAMAGGAGGLFGSALARVIDFHHADYLQHQLDKGGLLLWVHGRDAAHTDRAKQILKRHSGDDVHIHLLSADACLQASPQPGDLERALLDPTAVFGTPEDVLGRSDLSEDQQAAILQRWASDARDLEVASDEGMPAAEPDLLNHILQALQRLKPPTTAA